jgi:hypothetical protein
VRADVELITLRVQNSAGVRWREILPLARAFMIQLYWLKESSPRTQATSQRNIPNSQKTSGRSFWCSKVFFLKLTPCYSPIIQFLEQRGSTFLQVVVLTRRWLQWFNTGFPPHQGVKRVAEEEWVPWRLDYSCDLRWWSISVVCAASQVATQVFNNSK